MKVIWDSVFKLHGFTYFYLNLSFYIVFNDTSKINNLNKRKFTGFHSDYSRNFYILEFRFRYHSNVSLKPVSKDVLARQPSST